MKAQVSVRPVRSSIRIRGVVQGVGFRPAAYRLARKLGLGGFIRNEQGAVRLELEGAPERVAGFVDELLQSLPPAARLDAIEAAPARPRGEREFRIEPSTVDPAHGARGAAIGVDQAPCEACLREIAEPRARRYRHAFISCTDCGPRFTIVERGPYTRASTTMSAFAPCAQCGREYGEPGDRRFHAEANACPACGPQLAYIERGATLHRADAALAAAVLALASGRVLALKGAGGFVLAADATDERAVAALRERKRRPHKPFAVMARDLAHAERVAVLEPISRDLLSSPARPIVLVPLRPGASLAASVAPGLVEVGLMLPPTPLQHLLAQAGPPLQVMTSGNLSEEPIAKDDADALDRLERVADALLLHDRRIHARADDSVLRVIGSQAVPLRRARGYVPDALALPVCGPPVLAVGGQTKNTVCLAFDGQAVLSQHIGDLAHPAAFRFFEEAIAHLQRLTGATPRAVAHDHHPDYRATRWALDRGLLPVAVQHHHAHVAACMAEHGRTGPVFGAVFDGTGYGTDGGLWGGEILVADLAGFRRVAHLRALALPGGEAAIREPWRVALAALLDAGEPLDSLSRIDPQRVRAVRGVLEAGIASPRASGAGRWFDAVAALCGVRDAVSYDGQAALELEAVARGRAEAYAFELVPRPGGCAEIDLRPAICAIVADLRRGAAAAQVSARFHETLAAAVARACGRARSDGNGSSPSTVALSGGCFQNRRLAERTRSWLEREGFEVLEHRRVPPNDGGLSFGQAAVASFRMAESTKGPG